jgi:hypothetical protein
MKDSPALNHSPSAVKKTIYTHFIKPEATAEADLRHYVDSLAILLPVVAGQSGNGIIDHPDHRN